MPQITMVRTPQEFSALQARWESLCSPKRTTVFQNFVWNLLALTTFAGREEPWVVCAEASYGLAIVPAALRLSDASLRLLGEELFDYRSFLHSGDVAVLACALAHLAELKRPMQVIALREQDRTDLKGWPLHPFSAAPQVSCTAISPEEFGARHSRLARNLRRLQRQGFTIESYSGDNSALVRSIYERKAGQNSSSLFHDPLRIEFMVRAAQLQPQTFEIFTLERGPSLAAALVTLRDDGVRRFYTGWFAPEFEKLSPAMGLICEITRRSLAAGLDCDYMTGEQPYKMRLASSSVPLYRLQASAPQLAALGTLFRPLHVRAT